MVRANAKTRPYKVANAGSFQRDGEGWVVHDLEDNEIARFSLGSLCRGYLNKLREANETSGAQGKKMQQRILDIGKRSLKGELDEKTLAMFEGANRRDRDEDEVDAPAPRRRGTGSHASHP